MMLSLGSQLRRVVTALVVVMVAALALSVPFRTAAQAANGRIRFVHAVPGAGAVDIFVNGEPAAINLAFASATHYLLSAAGEQKISVRATGTTTELLPATVTLNAGQAKTVVLSGTQAVVATEYEDELVPIGAGKARFTAIHAVEGADPVDLLETSQAQVLVTQLAYGQPYGSVDIPAFASEVAVVPPDQNADQAITKTNVSLVAGTHNTVVILGSSSGQPPISTLLLSAPIASEDSASGMLRVVHANADAPAVDVYVGDTLVVPGLAFGAFTDHVAVPGQKETITVRAAGSPATGDALLTSEVDFSTIKAQTFIISGIGTASGAVIGSDNTSPLAPTTARIHLINATGSGVATLQIGSTTISSNDPTAAAGVEVPAINSFVNVSVDDPAIAASGPQTFSGGVLYDVVVAGTKEKPVILFAPTSLNESIGSVPTNPLEPQTVAQPPTATEAAVAEVASPTSDAAVVIAATPTEIVESVAATPTAPAIAQEPTLTGDQIVGTAVAATVAAISAQQPTAVPATPVPVEPTAIPTEAPVAAPTDVPVVIATATPAGPAPLDTSEGIFGEVNTDPGVNLKIREYPKDDARTLALAPSGTLLIIEGVKGPVPPPEAANVTSTVAPTATLNFEGVTLDQVWVFVTWKTADGGEITGWTKAQYLRITRDGLAVATVKTIFEFPLIPENQFGIVNSNLATPIALDVNNVIGTVVVDPGVRLQVRRTPSPQGESLTLLDSGAQVVVLQQTTVKIEGQPDTVWLYIRYQTTEGTVEGWVISTFITMTFKGRTFDIKELPATDNPQPGTTAGSVVVAAPTAKPGVIATIDKVNPGSNLQLRRTPDATAESLGLIPAGTQLSVLGRNGDGNWLNVSFNNTEGWISTLYVTVTKDGRLYNIAELKNLTEQNDIAASITPGPSPTATPAS
ncbi:MAG: DUF4397 domain-containing protein [Anaerolineae bacterium]|nr:DUF4397 domain-containing protein [Anaerolineae bacterium]